MNTMAAPLARAVRVAPDACAVRCEGRRRTYAELSDRCRRLAGALHELGLDRGDRIAVVGPNSDRYLELFLTVPSAGFVLVPVNGRLSDAEIRYILEDSGARVLFAGRDVATVADSVERVVEIPGEYEA